MAQWCQGREHQVASTQQPSLDLSPPAQGVSATKALLASLPPQNPSVPLCTCKPYSHRDIRLVCAAPRALCCRHCAQACW